MIVKELLASLAQLDSEKLVAIQWGWDETGEEPESWVEDLLLLAHADGLAKQLGVGYRYGVIFLTWVDDPEDALTVGDLVEILGDCKPEAKIGVVRSVDLEDEGSLGYVVATADIHDEVLALVAMPTEVIQS